MKRRLPRLLVLVAVVAAGAGIAWWVTRSEAPSRSEQRILYGNVEIRDAQLAFVEQERVTEVLVEEGEAVEQGQVLARLDRSRLAARLAEAQARLDAERQVLRRLSAGLRPQEIEQAAAELAAADVRVHNAEQRVRRFEDTARRGASTEQDLDDARAQLDLAVAERNVRREALALAREGYRDEEIAEARALVEAQRAQVTLLEQRLADTVLHAPADGVIQTRVLEPGEMALPSRTAFVLALTDPKWVRAWLPEPDLGHIRRGMRARVRSDSFPGRAFEGWVGFIAPQAEFTPKSVETTELRTQLVYETRIWVEDPGNELRLGMPVTVEIDTGGGDEHPPPRSPPHAEARGAS